MPITIGPVTLPRSAADLLDATDGYGTGALVQLESASSEGGSYTFVASETIVSGRDAVYFRDAAGTSSTWYRTWISKSDGSQPSERSAAFQAGSLHAYASLYELRQTLALGSTDTGHDALLASWLEDLSSELSGACGRRFYRSPQVTGTTTVYFDVQDCAARLSYATNGRGTTDGQALDIISITNLYVRDSETSAYVEVTAGDTGYYLQPGMGPGLAGTDWPYEDIVLSPAGAYTVFPTGYRAVKLVGVLGFPYVPGVIKRAVIAEAHERWRQSVSGGAAPQGVNQFGTPMFLSGNTDEWRTATRTPYGKRVYIA